MKEWLHCPAQLDETEPIHKRLFISSPLGRLEITVRRHKLNKDPFFVIKVREREQAAWEVTSPLIADH